MELPACTTLSIGTFVFFAEDAILKNYSNLGAMQICVKCPNRTPGNNLVCVLWSALPFILLLFSLHKMHDSQIRSAEYMLGVFVYF